MKKQKSKSGVKLREINVLPYKDIAKIGFIASLLCGVSVASLEKAYAQTVPASSQTDSQTQNPDSNTPDPNVKIYTPTADAPVSVTTPIVDNSDASVSVEQNGAGTTTFSAKNTYTGSTSVKQGTLTLSGAGDIASSSGVNVSSNATLDLSGVTADSASLTALTGDAGSSVALGSKSVALTNADGTFSGVVSGSGGLTIEQGTQTLAGANTYTGATAVNSGAALNLSGVVAGALNNAGSADVNGGTVSGAASNTGTLKAENATLADVANNSGTATLTNTTVGTITNAANATFNATNGTVKAVDNSGTATLNGTNADAVTNASGATLKATGGTLASVDNSGDATLGASNTVSGNVTNAAGSLMLDGNSVSGTLAANGGSFDVSQNGSSAGSLAGAANGTLDGTLNLTNANDTYSGILSGSGGLTVASTNGTETLSNANTYGGETAINSGILALTGAGSVSQSAGVQVNQGGNFDVSQVNGDAASIQSLSGAGDVTLDDKNLIITNGNNKAGNEYSGAASGGGGITITGGSETLSGFNMYRGATTVNQSADLTLSGSIMGEGLVVDQGGNATIQPGGMVMGKVRNDGTLTTQGTISDTITNTGKLVANGATFSGEVDNSGNATLTDSNATGRSLGVNNSGTLSASGGRITSVDNSGAATLTNSNEVLGNVTNAAGNLMLDGNIIDKTLAANGGSFEVSSKGSTVGSLSGSASGQLDENGTLSLTNANDTYSGSLAGKGSLAVTGGTETLTGGNAYKGDTIVAANAGLTVSNGGSLNGTNSVQNDGNVLLNNGHVTVPTNTSANWTGVIASGFSANSTASMTLQNGSTLDSSGGTLTAGFGTNSHGSVTIDNSTANVGILVLGEHGTGNVVVQNGGNLTAQMVVAGNQSDGRGSLDVTGTNSQLNVSSGLYVNGDGSGTVSVENGGVIHSGGQVSFGDGASVAAGSTGTLSISQDGTLEVGGTDGIVAKEGSNGSYQFNMAGGTLKDIGSDLSTSVDVTLVDGTNSTVDTNGLNTTLSGVLSGDGSLTKTSDGTLILTNANTYAGTTSVNAGVLQVDGSTGTGDTSVASGATLSGTGTVNGNATIASGGILSAGDGANGIGTLTVAKDLTLDKGSVQNFQTGQANVRGGQYNDLVAVGGNLQLGGTLNVVANTVGPDAQSGGLDAGVYRIYTYGGALSGQSDETLGKVDAASGVQLGLQTSIDKQVNLVVNDGNLKFWDGDNNSTNHGTDGSSGNGKVDGGSGTWTAMNGAGDNNWTNSDGSRNAPWYAGGYAVFEGTAGTVTVSNKDAQGNPAHVTFSSMQFANNDGGTYVVTGDELYATTDTTTVRVGDGTTSGASITADLDTVINDSNVAGGTSLVKSDAGTLVVTKDQTYRGDTTISGGTLQLGNGGTEGNIATTTAIHDNGVLAVDRSDAVTIGQVIDGSGSLTQMGKGTTTLAGSNTYQGGTNIQQGTLIGTTTSFGTGAITNNAALVVNQSSAGTLANVLQGSGSFTKSGAGSVEITPDDSGFTGGTTIAEGTLSVDGSLANSAVSVSNGATLSGVGSVGATTVASGATLSAGNATNAVGTLTVNGDLAMNSGSTLAAAGTSQATDKTVAVDGLSYQQMVSDLVKVNGAATLAGGTVNLNVAGAPALQYGQVYTLVSAQKGVTGKYDALQTNLQNTYTYISPTLVYTDNDVDVMMRRNDTSFSDGGDTRNERETGHGLDNLPESSPVVQAMEQLNGNDVKKGLNALSGEVHASARTALIQDSFFVRQAALDRLDSAECDGSLVDGSIHTAALKNGRDDGRCYSDRAVLWGEAYGSLGHNAGDGNAASMHHSTAGFIMGADTTLYDTWRVGGLISYGRSMFDVKSGRGSSGHSNNVTVGGYAGNHWGNLNLRLGATYTWDMLSIQRNVNFTGYRDRLSSGYLGGTAQAFAELGYKFRSGHTTIEPFGNVAYVNLHTNGYTEHGGAAALHGRGTDTGVTFSTFGIRAASTFQVGKLQLTPRGTLSYRHAFGLTTATTHQMFAAAGNGDMDIAGVALSTDAAVIDTGITAKITDQLDVGLSYIGQYGKQSVDSGARARFRLKF